MNDMRQELIQTRGSATFAFDAEVSIELAPAQART
ncbi:methylenetetrahydrofolate reductase, partial [Mesorhizobium sp. M7A.F.Ca.US.003.02.2.1]